jgi:hypothetical protein
MTRPYTYSGEQLELELDAPPGPDADVGPNMGNPVERAEQEARIAESLRAAKALIDSMDAARETRKLQAILDYVNDNGGLYAFLLELERRRNSSH